MAERWIGRITKKSLSEPNVDPIVKGIACRCKHHECKLPYRLKIVAADCVLCGSTPHIGMSELHPRTWIRQSLCKDQRARSRLIPRCVPAYKV